MKILSKNLIVASKSGQKKLVNFFPAGEKGQILNFIGLFCLKGKLAEPKVLTGVWYCDTEGP